WDILPTLCELAGTPAPPDTDGISFLPTLLGQDQPRRHSFLYWESPGYGGQQAIIADHWKAVRQQLRQQANNSTLKTELYHLEMDESETNDLAEAQPEILKEMIKLLERGHQPSVLFPLPGVDPSGVNRPQKNR
ncbi:MAG TPA: N-acetylgalactosamine-6-sulfatase, partial [Gemmatales bacterium]|nr:N-acetylgalactosamine-6-sulfatase [Gemmatales bacterium]